jgi:hypothetical protein
MPPWWWAHLVACRPKLAEVHLRVARFHLRHFVASADRSVDSLRGYKSEGWAHFEFTRINIKPIILCKEFEDLREAGASMSDRERNIPRSDGLTRTRGPSIARC